VGWVIFKIWEQPILEHLCILSISWFAFVTLGLFGPKWLGVTGEHPRVVVCLRKFVMVRFHHRKGRNQSSGRRKRSWKRLQLEWPTWSSRADLSWLLTAPLTKSRSWRRPNFGKTNIMSRSLFTFVFVIFCGAWGCILVFGQCLQLSEKIGIKRKQILSASRNPCIPNVSCINIGRVWYLASMLICLFTALIFVLQGFSF
jgi:hypothetical protein